MKNREAAIVINELSFNYPDKTQALKKINLTVFTGECLGIIGANGAGKSTLLLHLNGILRGSGNVTIGSKRICKKNLKTIRAKVGMVFQDPNHQLFMPTLADDMAFGPLNFGMSKQNVATRINRVLEALNIGHLSEKSPYQMSLGERKAASLATVLVMSPEITVFDEPTVSLDPHSRRKLLNLIMALKGTKIIASHDLDMVYQICDRVALMSQGRLVTQGRSKEILNDRSLLEKNSLEVPLSLMLEEAQKKIRFSTDQE